MIGKLIAAAAVAAALAAAQTAVVTPESPSPETAPPPGRCSIPLTNFYTPGGMGFPMPVVPVPEDFMRKYPKAFFMEPPAPPCDERAAAKPPRPNILRDKNYFRFAPKRKP